MRRSGLATLAALALGAMTAPSPTAAAAPAMGLPASPAASSAMPSQTGECAAADFLAVVAQARDALARMPPDVSRARDLLTALHDTPEASGNRDGGATALAPALRDLSAVPARSGSALRRLAAVLDVLALPHNAVCESSDAAARSDLDRVYSSPVFANLGHKRNGGVLQSLFDAVAGFLARAFTTLATAIHGGAGPGVLAVLAILAIGLVAAFARERRRAWRPAQERFQPSSVTSDPELEWSAALAAASRRDYREAVRRAYRSALLACERKGRLRVDPAWTTSELLSHGSADPALTAALEPAARGFDEAWYSGRVVSDGQWEEERSRCEALGRVGQKA